MQAAPREPFFILPGFAPDAVGFAVRTTLALLLAYLIAFWAQLETASSAGLCVAIVSQASPGMAMSKAIYRTIGTVLGGVAAVAMVGAFGQDRTMLLLAFTLWLGACSFVAALLRDFRSYGAVLCGYTVGIIAVSSIDAPQGALLATLNRVAAILLGIACVAVVNSLLSHNVAYETLRRGLAASLAQIRALGRDALAGGPVLTPAASVDEAAKVLALTSQASYAATELPDGRSRVSGARQAIAAMLAMLAAIRAVSNGHDAGALPGQAAAHAAFVAERQAELAAQDQRAQAAIATLELGAAPMPGVRLRVHYDAVGAGLSAARTMISVGLGSVFCILSGQPGVTGLLVQQAAFTALLGMQANPSAAGTAFGLSLPVPAVVAGIVGFLVLPAVSGFVPFALAVGSCVFIFALASHHPRTAPYGPGLLLYFALLLGPSNTQSFDLAGYLNTVLVQGVAVLFMLLAFRLILPVSPARRLFRLADAIVRDLEHTLKHGRALDFTASQSLKFDRLVQAQGWFGRATPARLAVFGRLYAFAELDTALRRAWSGLEAARCADPGRNAALETARAALLRPTPDGLAAAGDVVLAHAGVPDPALQRAASGLYGAQLLLRRQARALRHYRIAGG